MHMFIFRIINKSSTKTLKILMGVVFVLQHHHCTQFYLKYPQYIHVVQVTHVVIMIAGSFNHCKNRSHTSHIIVIPLFPLLYMYTVKVIVIFLFHSYQGLYHLVLNGYQVLYKLSTPKTNIPTFVIRSFLVLNGYLQLK